MINAALIEYETIVNVIYIDAENMTLFEAQGMELIDSAPLGLTMGDVRIDGQWHREVDGEMVLLPLTIEQEEESP